MGPATGDPRSRGHFGPVMAGPGGGPSVRPRLRAAGALVVAAMVALAALVIALPAGVAAGGGATLRIVSSASSVGPGETFTVSLVQNASVPTTGAQLNVVFDPRFVHVVDMKPGAAYAGGVFQFGSADDGSNKSVAAAAARANETGILRNVAAFFLPPDSVAPGDAVVVDVTLRAQAGPGGAANLELRELPTSPIQMLDETGNLLPVTTAGMSIQIAAAPGSTGSGATPLPTIALPTFTPSPTSDLVVGEGEMTMTTDTPDIRAGDTADLIVKVSTPLKAHKVLVDLIFDQAALQIVRIEPGTGWENASLIVVSQTQTLDQLIDQANGSGRLSKVGISLPPVVLTTPPPDGIVIKITMRALKPTKAPVSLADGYLVAALGQPVVLNFDRAKVVLNVGEPSGNSILPAGIAIVIVTLVVMGVRGSGRRPALRRRSWPYAISLVLALLPVAAFVAIAVALALNSARVLDRPGLGGLLGDVFSSRFSGTNLGLYGMLPALSGTVLISVLAIAIALPVSLAMAIVATEFPFGPVGRILRPLIEVLGGIPPILYAVSGVVFVTQFIIPKFAAASTFPLDPTKLGVAADAWPPPGVPYNPGAYPWDPSGTSNSTLLGGILIGLLVIPFLTPLIADAVRNVPSGMREASLALGANRRTTLRRVILPMASPGIAAAVSLSALKALGDTLIVVFAVGWEAQRIPNPVFDVLERTPGLTAQAAGLLGAFQSGGGVCWPTECAVGYSAALLLLLIAGGIVIVMSVLQARWRRRLGL